jgi:transposase-like protein
MDKYGLRKEGTIMEWLNKYSTLDKHSYQRTKTTDSLRRQATREIESGKLTIREASQKYHVGENTLKRWVRLYSCSLINPQQEMENPKLPVQGHNQSVLLRTIEELKLKVAGLEIMIDIAEKELEVDIRKKCGTKQ